MNKQDQAALDRINAELERQGVPERFKPHRFWGISHQFEIDLPKGRMMRFWPGFSRRLDVFTPDDIPGSCFGRSEVYGAGPFRGRGWCERVGKAAAEALKEYR